MDEYEIEKQEHLSSFPATAGVADREAAYVAGAENEERAWILSDRDVWYKNPFYQGPAVPHPEED